MIVEHIREITTYNVLVERERSHNTLSLSRCDIKDKITEYLKTIKTDSYSEINAYKSLFVKSTSTTSKEIVEYITVDGVRID